MILLLDTSTPVCYLTLIIGNKSYSYNWEASRSLARDLLGFLEQKMLIHSKKWSDIKALGVYEGPGSFTGLRIGITVMNTIADSLQVPIVGGRGHDWEKEVVSKLSDGNNKKIVLPYYGAEANITVSKK